MEIKFHNGSVYQYYNIPKSAHQGWMRGSSKGQYLHLNIKGRYHYKPL